MQNLVQDEVDVSLEDLEAAAAKGGCQDLMMRFKKQSVVTKQTNQRSTARGYLVDGEGCDTERCARHFTL